MPGDTFGDFSEARGRKYKPGWVISTGAPTLCLVLRNSDLERLFSKALTPSNLECVERGIGSNVSTSVSLIKKLCRCFTEREFPAHTELITEDKKVASIFLIKSGTCEALSRKDPLRC